MLTTDMVDDLAVKHLGNPGIDPENFARAIEAEVCKEQASKLAELERQLEAARKDSEMMRQVNRACLDLPDGYEIEIRLENGAGTIRMTDECGDNMDFCEDFDEFSDVLKSAIDAARKDQP